MSRGVRDDIETLRAREKASTVKLNAVRDLHYPIEGFVGMLSCGTCHDAEYNEVEWPCPTAKALGES